jgi:hypothetical protein
MAIDAIIRKTLRNDLPEHGARAATRALNLSDYHQLFEKRSIYAGFRGLGLGDEPLYRRILGDAFEDLPAQIQAIHDDTKARCWAGEARVQRGAGLLSRVVGRLFGFPPRSDKIPVRAQFDPAGDGEKWMRTFGNRSFHSVQKQGFGKNGHLLMERFGPVEVALALVVQDDRLYLIPRRWSVFGLPLPKFLLPSGASFEAEVDGRFQFDVEISAPVVGLIASYQGRLELCAEQ